MVSCMDLSLGSKALNLAVLIFLGRGDPWFFSVEDSSHSRISSIGGSYCLLQEDTLSIRPYNLTTRATLPSPG